MNRFTLRPRLLAAAVIVAACTPSTPQPQDTSPAAAPPVEVPGRRPPSTTDQEWDRAVIEQLEREARRLARTDGCRDVNACRTAPVGVKACGGPRDYIVYCATATDTVALFRKLQELARAERAYNEKYHIMSTCELMLEPGVALVGQSCRAVR